jgi:quercetin dioxygenase-like cupin family protein
MEGKFRLAQELEAQDVGIATLRWMCHPASTGARQLTVVEATLAPGKGHSFHQHPDQEEMVYVVSGKVEQWVGRERRILGPGDAAFMPAGTVHASFCAGDGEARLLAVFGPSIGSGFETIEMAEEAPWNTLRVAEPVAG